MHHHSLSHMMWCTVAVVAGFVPCAAQQHTSELFERARMLDESNQNLPEAIRLYTQVVAQAKDQRTMAAQAQLRIGLLYERLGRKAEALKAFKALVGQFPDQTDLAERARAKIGENTSQTSKPPALEITRRGPNRAVLDQFWTTQSPSNLGLTPAGTTPMLLKSDGADIWVSNYSSHTVSRVRASDGRLLETWTGATKASGVLVAMGKVFVTGVTNPGSLYEIDPTEPAASVKIVSRDLGRFVNAIAFDGARIWTGNGGTGDGSISIITLSPLRVETVHAGFVSVAGVLFDGSNVWVADAGASALKKLNSDGTIAQTVAVGTNPIFPVFDGTNIWAPNAFGNTVSVVRASTGRVVATLTGNGLNQPSAAAFDGQRILVTNFNGNSVSLWRAADLTPVGSFSTGEGTHPYGVCSDGVNFWIALFGANQLARF